MDKKRDDLLMDLMALDFTIFELNLYLDTHPDDQQAIGLYNHHVEKAKVIRDAYENQYGPLTARCVNRSCQWQWIAAPWPWAQNFLPHFVP